MILKGYNALVFGGSKGIGLASAKSLAAEGANVTIVARNTEQLKEAVQMIKAETGADSDFMSIDAADTQDLHKKLQILTNTRTFHIVVNNSGGPPSGPITNATPEEFKAAFNQHLIANHVIALACLGGMKSAGYGRIINIISTSVKQPLDNLGVSNTVRAAVANWSKTLSNEVAQFGITVNNVLPGATETERLEEIAKVSASKQSKTVEEIYEQMANASPAKRIGKPEEVAAAVVFLASPLAGYINGINLPVDGGRTKSL
jgi:3-oxoacyl-[acyl-carrier protein] reductase